MDWIHGLIFGSGVSHSAFILSLVICSGVWLGRFKTFGISLGITYVLFMGILLSSFGLLMDPEVLAFIRDFGLILFVFAVGMQVGPGFFSSFKRGGVTYNLLAVGMVALSIIVALLIQVITGTSMTTMIGVLFGAVCNTPGLGAAQTAFHDVTGLVDNSMAMGFAVTYPLGVIGVLMIVIIYRACFKIDAHKEGAALLEAESSNEDEAFAFSFEVQNPAIYSKTIKELAAVLKHRRFIVARVWPVDGSIDLANAATVLNKGDKMLVITTEKDKDTIQAFVGPEIDMKRKEWMRKGHDIVSRRIVISKQEINGKCLRDLNLSNTYNINVTRINRSGIDLVAHSNLRLQFGDKLHVVGTEASIKNSEKVLGNSLTRLNQPHLITIFIGIALGIFVGSIPLAFPGIPQPVKLGLAGGPLIVAILISSFGYKYGLITYTTQSANLMLRDIGITMFLACVGLGAGQGFVDTIVNQGGWSWIGYGFLITFIPPLIISFIALKFCKINFFALVGILAGASTNPPILSYGQELAGNDSPAISYATVFPLVMFLRVVSGQILVLLFC